jgi:hypothetical protein
MFQITGGTAMSTGSKLFIGGLVFVVGGVILRTGIAVV